jgi:hypothetical protein
MIGLRQYSGFDNPAVKPGGPCSAILLPEPFECERPPRIGAIVHARHVMPPARPTSGCQAPEGLWS